jgi:ABC-type branched-subunit amino acid transport system permease subunit
MEQIIPMILGALISALSGALTAIYINNSNNRKAKMDREINTFKTCKENAFHH